MTTFLKTIAILFLSILCEYSIAQVNQPIRIEIPVDESYDFYAEPIANSTNALIVSKTRDKSSKTITRNFEILNESLKSIKKTQVESPMDFTYSQYIISDNHYYLFQYNKKKGIYQIMDMSLSDLSNKTNKGQMLKGLAIIETNVLNGNLFISSYTKKGNVISILNILSNSVQTIYPSELTPLKIMYTDMEILDDITSAKEVAFKYKACEKDGCDFLMLRFNSEGKQVGEFFFLPKANEDKELTSITISKLATDQYFITGSYSISRSKMANGIYVAKVNSGKVEFINYINFLDLNNFTSYLSKKQQDKIEKKKKKKEDAGEEFSLNYRVTVHDITVKDGEYFFLGEFYYPTYRTETYTTMGPNGTMVTHSRQVFDGFQYSHAVVAGFNMTGKLIWSNTFEMSLSYKPFSVRQFIRMNIDGENTKLVYLTGSRIKTITFKKNQIINDEYVSLIETKEENDEVKRTYSGDILWWYDKNYLSYGTQIIKNKEEERGNRKREVFFVNKISY